MLLLVLSQENVSLAVEEVLRVFGVSKYVLSGRYLLLDVRKNLRLCGKLAYTNEVYSVLFSGPSKKIFVLGEKFNWKKVYEKNYCVRSFCSVDEKKFAAVVWHALKDPMGNKVSGGSKNSKNFLEPKVNLKKAVSFFGIFKIKKEILVGKRIWVNSKDFLKRKAHMKPSLHPSSLNPRLARCMVNLVGDVKKIVDPFCGSGGILVEALFLGKKVIGVDIDRIMVKRCLLNVTHYRFQKDLYDIIVGDALEYTKKVSCVVTDIPYGKNTKTSDGLLSGFLKQYASLTSTMIVGFPDSVDVRKVLRGTPWKITFKTEWYLHKSLSKIVCVLEC
jgi:tRNA (guanine10-N2)-dimethyltransferase